MSFSKPSDKSRSPEPDIPMNALRTCVLLTCSTLASACDNHRIAGPEEMRGEWLLVRRVDNGARTEQRMTFAADGSLRSETQWLGFYGLPATEVTGYMRQNGRKRFEGSTLLLRIERSETWQKYAVGPNPSVVTVRKPEWTERGSVRVEGDQLLHTFVSAPADAPETFTAVYQRLR